MFGYVKPYTPRLEMWEYEIYNSAYCGLCKCLGDRYGFIARCLLSYDLAFLTLLHSAVNQKEIDVCRQHCMIHPIKKKNCCKPCRAVKDCSDFLVLLTYHKLKDDLQDEHGFLRQFAVRFLLIFFKKYYAKASKAFPECSKKISEAMKMQREFEKTGGSFDQLSEPTAKIMQAVFEECSDDPKIKMSLRQMGHFMGRYVYLCDAIADYEQDIKKGRYNPLVSFKNNKKEIIKLGNMYINAVSVAYLKLEKNDYSHIIDNFVYAGLKNTLDKLINKSNKNRKRG